MSEKLEPCPFCGCAVGLVTGFEYSMVRGDHALTCVFLDDEPVATAAEWNSRAQRDEGLARGAEMERENRLLRHDCASFLETMAKTCDLLGIDPKSAQNAQGKPSDVLYEHAKDLQHRLAEAEKRMGVAADLLRRAKRMVPVLQYNWHANTDALLASPGCANGEKRVERGSEHGFEQSPNSCRHDEKSGVWWQERGVTRTGRECVACGHVDEDGCADGENPS